MSTSPKMATSTLLHQRVCRYVDLDKRIYADIIEIYHLVHNHIHVWHLPTLTYSARLVYGVELLNMDIFHA